MTSQHWHQQENFDLSTYKCQLIEDLMSEITNNHEKIIDDWYKVQLADAYERNGQIRPCDFILRKEPVFEKVKGKDCDLPCFSGYRYWFEQKNKE
jgi:hypothetical protein